MSLSPLHCHIGECCLIQIDALPVCTSSHGYPHITFSIFLSLFLVPNAQSLNIVLCPPHLRCISIVISLPSYRDQIKHDDLWTVLWLNDLTFWLRCSEHAPISHQACESINTRFSYFIVWRPVVTASVVQWSEFLAT
jgi:hypothetical protein